MSNTDIFGDLILLDAAPIPTTRLKGQGRKGKEFEAKVHNTLINEGDLDYQVARARKESWQAKTVELDYHVKQGAFVSREEVRQVCATAYSSLTQSLRSIPDSLERREGVSPQVAEQVGLVIDEVLGDIAAAFEQMGGTDE